MVTRKVTVLNRKWWDQNLLTGALLSVADPPEEELPEEEFVGLLP
jgi:hypothetical protein